MKKSIIVMMVAVLLVSALFVSCKQEIATPQDSLGTVRISLPSSRDLTPGTPTSIILAVDHWYYVATKHAGDYYRTGETSWGDLAAMASGQEVGTTGFSAGEWTFSFYGFNGEATAEEKADAIYYAEGIVKDVVASTNNYIDVTLQIGGGVGFGKVYFQNLTFNDSAIPSGLTLKINNTEVTTPLPYVITITAEGDFPCTVELYSGTQLVASASTSITVSKGYDYYIEGDINQLDQLGIVIIDKVEYQKSATDTKIVVPGAETTFKTPVSPEGSETTVTFGAGALTAGEKTLTTTVTGSESAGAFVIDNVGSSVASIDLSLEGASPSEFSGAVTVTTYIAKGLTNPQVYYIGTEAAPQKISYDADTGKFVFTTTHFSQFVVVSEDEIIVSDGTVYATLAAFATAVNGGNSFAGKTVTLMKDVNLSGTWTPIGTEHRKESNPTKVFSGTFDGKGHTISGLSSNGYTPAPSTVDLSEYTYGLFGYVKNGTVRNVTLRDVAISESSYQLENAGGVVGYLDGGTVVNCSVIGTSSVRGFNGIGGVVGRAYGTCTIENCTNTAAVQGSKNVAGVVGFVNPLASGTIKVLNCTNNGNVSRVSGATANEGAAAGIACYGCSDSSVVYHATSNLYISGNVCDENAQITNVTPDRVDRINFLTSHGPTTTTGTVSVQ